MESQRCKGMQDLLPKDMLCFRHIEDVFRDYCLKWGYQEVRTPTLEYLHLFTATGTLTPSTLGKVYSFLDWNGWSGERVVLRPDGTIPVARLYINNLSEHEVAKLFYVTNIFAFEETSQKSRERWQCGAEFLGDVNLTADAEVISLAKQIVHKLNLNNVRLQLSHAGLVKALISELNLSHAEEAKVTSRVLDGDWQALMKAKTARPELDKFLSPLLSLKGKSSAFLQNAKTLCQQASPVLKPSMENFINIATLLDNLDCNYEIDITAIRGFEYYTGVCFQLLADGRKIGGGGRYDGLIPLMGGENVPACGFALYIDSIMELLLLESKKNKEPGILIEGEKPTPEIARMCFTLAQSLREAKHTVRVDFSKQEPDDYRWVISISEGEPSQFTLTDCKRQRRWNITSTTEILKILGG